MNRSAAYGLALSVLLLAMPSGAAAKEIRGMRICGDRGCTTVPRAEAQRYHDVGGLEGVPAGARRAHGPFYRIAFAIGDGDGRSMAGFTNVYLPDARLVAPLVAGARGDWMRLGDRAAQRLDRLASGLRPCPASALPKTRAELTSRPPAVREPGHEEADAGVPAPLIAGVPAAALLLGAGLVAVRRRRH